MQKYFAGVQVGEKLPPLSFDVNSTSVISGALASRDYSPLHHDKSYAIEQAGHKDIFLNTPTQAGFFERFLSDWAGGKGRIGRLKFSMKASVYPDDGFIITGEVIKTEQDQANCGWLSLSLQLTVDNRLMTDCKARYALPLSDDDNPWQRSGEQWIP